MAKRSSPPSAPPSCSRRDLLRWAALSPLALATSAEAARPIIQGAARVRIPAQHETTAGGWRPWLVSSVDSLLPPAPPSRSSRVGQNEFQELRDLQKQRGDAVHALIAFWEAQGGIPQWTQILLNTIQETRINPVRAARAIALLETALADTSIATWRAKFHFQRLPPAILDPSLISLSQSDHLLPSYPSEHAALGHAAAAVLSYLFPGYTPLVNGRRISFAALASEAALSRLWAGANYRSDMEAGAAIGQAVGALAIARGQSDGSSAVWDASSQPGRLVGPQYWVPTPPANAFPPLEPLAGTWRTWVLETPHQFEPPPPPGLQGSFPSPAFLAEANEVYQTVRNLTPDQRQIALFWADGAGTVTPPGHWVQFAAAKVGAAQLSTPRAARALALVGAGVADSAIACWECKFKYWLLRPVTAIRTLAGQPFYDPNFVTPIATPPFPAYSSGHSTFSGCSAAVLAHLFPGGTVPDAFGQLVGYDAAADQAAVSRLYGGIHYRSDNDEGLTCGRKLANLVIARAQSDGAP